MRENAISNKGGANAKNRDCDSLTESIRFAASFRGTELRKLLARGAAIRSPEHRRRQGPVGASPVKWIKNLG